MDHIYKKKIILIISFTLILITTLMLVKYRTNVYEVNKEYYQKLAYEEAKNHFENLKIFRFWNGINSGVYVKSNGTLEPSKYLSNNHIFSKDGDLLVRVDPSRMTSQLAELMNNTRNEKHNYKTTSFKPLNPENEPDEFEKEALTFFQKNSHNNYYFKIDENKKIFNLWENYL